MILDIQPEMPLTTIVHYLYAISYQQCESLDNKSTKMKNQKCI